MKTLTQHDELLVKPYIDSKIQTLTNQVKDMNNVLGAKNLLPNGATTQVKNGVTFTVNDDGSVRLTGTATASAYIDLLVDLTDGVTYTASGISGGSSTTYQVFFQDKSGGSTNVSTLYDGQITFTKNSGQASPNNYDVHRYRIRVASGATVDTVIKPMIRLASITDDTYEPYAKTNQQLTETTNSISPMLNVLGAKNLIPLSVETQTINGVTITVQDDGSIILNGTATAGIYLGLTNKGIPLKSGKCILSGASGGSISTYHLFTALSGGATLYQEIDGQRTAINSRDGDSAIFDINKMNTTSGSSYVDPSEVNIRLGIANGYTCNNVLIKPMIRLASISDDTYAPYAKSNKELTEDVKTLSDTTIRVATLTDKTKFTGTIAAVKHGRNVILASDVKIFANSVFTTNEVIASGLPLPIPSSQIATTAFAGIAFIGNNPLMLKVNDNGELLIQAFTNGSSDIYGRILLSYIAKD